jgi:hypothetical protein
MITLRIYKLIAKLFKWKWLEKQIQQAENFYKNQ